MISTDKVISGLEMIFCQKVALWEDCVKADDAYPSEEPQRMRDRSRRLNGNCDMSRDYRNIKGSRLVVQWNENNSVTLFYYKRTIDVYIHFGMLKYKNQ